MLKVPSRPVRAVLPLGRGHVGLVSLRDDLAEEAEGQGLVAALTALPGEREGPIGANPGVLDVPREQIRLTDLDETDSVEIPDPRGIVPVQGLPPPVPSV